jgi:hypothetical protein
VETVLDGGCHLTSQESTLLGQGVHFPIAQNKGRSLVHHTIIQSLDADFSQVRW